MVRHFLFALSLAACSNTLYAAAPKPAYEILPQTVQAVVWVQDANVLADQWERTELSQLANDPAFKDFWQDQQQQIESKLTTAGWRLHIQPRDLTEVVQGQIALAWIERREDVRKPFGLAMIVDVVNKAQQTQTFLQKLDAQLKERGAQRNQLKHGGAVIVQHTLPRQNGELLPQETFYAVVGEQLLASDDLGTLHGLIDAAAGVSPANNMLSSDSVFQSARQHLNVSNNAQVEYFARPLGFARVLRSIGGKRRGGKADVLAVLEGQGFDKILAVCGEVKIGEENFDAVHRGFVLSDGKLTDLPDSVQILDFPNEAGKQVPNWVSNRVSSMLSSSWNVKEAFWKAEGLVDAMAGQKDVFGQIIEGIKVDPTGPRIDIAKDVMPLLTNEIYSISDATLPIQVNSRRNMIALRLTDSAKMSKILNQAMQTEPDAEQINVGGQTIWQVSHKEDDLAIDLDADFGNFNKGNPAAAPANEPLLTNWAITVYGEYLMFASHLELITEAIDQAKQGNQSPLNAEQDFQRVLIALSSQFGDDPGCAWSVNRSALAYRPQYELFRAGKLQESESWLAKLIEYLLQNKSEIVQKKPVVDGAKLPPFEVVSKYLQPGGTFVQSTENGWSYGAVLLAKAGGNGAPPAAARATDEGEQNAANKPLQGSAKTR